MKSLKDCVGKSLTWKHSGFNLENPDELFCGEDLVAKLVWKPEYLLSSKKPIKDALKSSRKFKAEGQTKEGKWILERSGFLDGKLLAKKQNKIVGKCFYGINKPWKTVDMELGREKFRVHQKIGLKAKYILEDKNEKELIIFETNLVKTFTLRKGGVKIKISQEAKSLKNLSLLVLFFFYFLNMLTWNTMMF